jgi:hypothetical protein
MKNKFVLTFEIDKLTKNEYLFVPNKYDENGNCISDLHPAHGDYKGAAEALKSSPELIEAVRDAFQYLVEQITEKLHEDLQDLYNAIPKEK